MSIIQTVVGAIVSSGGTTPTTTYTLTPAYNNVNEGASLTFTVGGTNIPDGNYYWTIADGSWALADFSTINGSVYVVNSYAVFSVTPTADVTTEGAETFNVTLRSVSITGTILATSSAVTINDTSIGPSPFSANLSSDDSILQGQNGWWSYVQNGGGAWLAASAFSVSAPTYNTITYPDTVTTGHTYDFTAGQYLISPTLVRAGAWATTAISIDFWFYPTANGVQLLTELGQPQLSADYHTTLLEIDSSSYVKARFWQSGGGIAQIITSSNTVNLNQWNHIYFAEDINGAHTFALNNVATTDLSIYTRAIPSPNIYYAVGGSDITNMGNTGGFQGKIGILDIRDHVAASTYTDGYYSKFFAPTLTYALIPYTNNVNEGSSLQISIGGTNVPPGTYYWTIETGASEFATTSGAFVVSVEGSVLTGQFNVTPTEDVTTEGAETFTVALRSGSTTGTILATTDAITINDTSLAPVAPVPPFSLQFVNSENDYLDVAASSDFNLDTTWTIEFWLKANAKSETAGGGIWGLVNQVGWSTTNAIVVALSDNKLVFLSVANSANDDVRYVEPTPGQWTHVAIANDAGTQKVFYNGAEQTRVSGNVGTASYTNSTDPVRIGRLGPSNGGTLDGKMALVRISNTAKYLTAFTPITTYGVETDTKLFLGTDTPLVDLSTYELNGVATVSSNSGAIYISKSAYPNLDKQIQVGNTVVNADTSASSTVIAAVYTADPDNWGVDYSPAFGTAVFTANFSGARPITNNGVTESNDVPGAFAPQSLAFNGSTNYLDVVSGLSDFNLGTTWTIEFWSKATTSSTGNLFTVMSQNADSNTIDILYQDGNLTVNNGRTLCAEPTPGVWTHVVLVSDGEELNVYYNGVSVYNGGVYSVVDSTNSLNIGKRGQIPYQYFNGRLALIRISNTAKYATAFTPTVTYGVEADTKLFLGKTVPFIDAKGHAVTNTGVTQSASFPVIYTVRQWLGSYDPGSSNSALYVRLSDYPDAGSIPVGAKTAIGTVSITYVDTYSGTPAQFLQLAPSQLMGSGDYFTFVWSS